MTTANPNALIGIGRRSLVGAFAALLVSGCAYLDKEHLRRGPVYVRRGATDSSAASHEERVPAPQPAEQTGDVFALDGNITLADGTVLTRTGRDFDPCLSPDGASVAFCRRRVRSADPRDPESDLYLLDIATGKERLLVAHGQASDTGNREDWTPSHVRGVWGPCFSPDGRTVYFLSRAWETSPAAHAVDLNTGDVRFVTDALTLEVVPSGRYRGDLIVMKHKYFAVGGSYDWYWLVTPEGREVDPIGEDDYLQEFRQDYFHEPAM